MIIKCKMCGGDIQFAPGDTYGTCEYCGSTSTIPKADDEIKLNRYNRANHFRRQCEFDKALSAYEKILEQDDTDAEAHWGAALCRYGIEYVEDPATKQRIPTCHRLQVTSILADDDYLAAVRYAPDDESRRLYEQQANQIAEIQKGILAISSNEKPYDVFICYKEADDSGRRTRDSQWAQDVYYGLTDAGCKVFFSRITLEDKLGQQYEPYIFAALNSAKVMIVIGSRPEYFSAVWVKNEWSRYLALMEKDRKRLLIPCYRDMDPYDLPEELSTLQSQDMSKIGFIQDLLRGVKKVLDSDKKPEPTKTVIQTASASAPAPAAAAAPGVSSLTERAYLFMEDGDFSSAKEYLDRVLDIDPKYAPAYAAKVCAALHFCKESDLANASFLYEDNADWKKAMRFADPAQKQTYQGYIDKVQARIRTQVRSYAYDCAMALAVCTDDANSMYQELTSELNAYAAACRRSTGQHADSSRRPGYSRNEAAFKNAVRSNEPGQVSEACYKLAARRFSAIGDDEARARARECLALGEQARQQQIYQDAVAMRSRSKGNVEKLRQTIWLFADIPDYKDAKVQAQQCQAELDAILGNAYVEAARAMEAAGTSSGKWAIAKRKLSNEILDGYCDVEALRAQADRRCEECIAAEKEADRRLAAEEEAKAKRIRTIRSAAIAAVAAAIAILLLVTQIVIPACNHYIRDKQAYKQAIALRTAEQYDEAAAAFSKLGNYKDAAEQLLATYYVKGEALLASGDYDAAAAAFSSAGDYDDAAGQLLATYYAKGEALLASGDYDAAAAAFSSAGDYSDAAGQLLATYYAKGEALLASGDYDAAVMAFTSAGDYDDAAEQLLATYYAKGEALLASGDYDAAAAAFTDAGDYGDAADQILESKYQKAQSLYAIGDYVYAYITYKDISSYKDVGTLLATDTNLIAVVTHKAIFSVGNYVEFGTYPQTESGDDATAIEWLVLARDGNRALLLSRHGLDTQPYNEDYEDVTWEKCTLRTWLNDTFINKAFTEEEQSAILLTDVNNGQSQCCNRWDTTGGNDTQDKVFLLSYAEANEYLDVTYENSDNMVSRIVPTDYAKKQGAQASNSKKTADGEYAVGWWLRSPGNFQFRAAFVTSGGALYYDFVRSSRIRVRPALWVNLESGIF